MTSCSPTFCSHMRIHLKYLIKNLYSVRKIQSADLVEPIKIIPCAPKVKLISMQFQVELLMSYMSSGRQFFFWFRVVAL